jgi:hypothetical protein
MKRKLLYIISILLVISGLFLLINVLFSFKHIEKGALQVTANIKSKVYLNGKYIGDTQLCKCDQGETIPSGDYEIRIEPEDTSFSAFTTRAKINGGVLTAVDRTFLPGSLANSYTLTLDKSSSTKPKLTVTTIPDGALVTIDSEEKGITPFTTSDLSASEHELELQKEGFSKKTIRIKSVGGYKLIVNAQLGTQGTGEENIGPTTTPTTSITPTPSTAETKSTVTITDTPNGFLRVRNGAGTTFSEIGRVKPGETYDLLQEKSGWYQIQVDDKTTGWISSTYAKKN